VVKSATSHPGTPDLELSSGILDRQSNRGGPTTAGRCDVDRAHFLLDEAAQQEWELINSRPARSLSGLVRLLERPSPFGSGAFGTPPADADRE
jgi:hypothetical protein